MKKFLPWIIVGAIIWFIVTWLYISLNIFDVSALAEGEYKILTFREKFLELFLLVGMLAFGFCLGRSFCAGEEEMYGFVPQIDGKDDLKLIEGIGPKINSVLMKNGIQTFEALANADEADVKKILTKAGKQFQLANPKTWSEQSMLANKRKWKELKEYQDFLDGGV